MVDIHVFFGLNDEWFKGLLFHLLYQRMLESLFPTHSVLLVDLKAPSNEIFELVRDILSESDWF